MRIKGILLIICVILFTIGIMSADSENLLIPFVLVLIGSIGILKLTKEDENE